MALKYFVLAWVLLLGVSAQTPDEGRRDCYPWPGASQELCEARGCVWESSPTPGVPFCFYNDRVCPSQLPESSRIDCFPSPGATKDACNQLGCVWCESETPGVPFCFIDPFTEQGGNVCPADYNEFERVDCHPDPVASGFELQQTCLARGCYYCESGTPDVPWCFMPRSHGYREVGRTELPNGFQLILERVNHPSWFGADYSQIRVDVLFHNNERLQIRIADPELNRFQVPDQEIFPSGKNPSNPLYDVETVNDPAFAIRVIRRSTGAVIFDTSIGGLVFSDQFLQYGTYLNTGNIYGFGEHEHHTMRHNMSYVTWGMWTRDLAVSQANLYGQQPVYMNIEEEGNAHMVLIMNANAQEVQLVPEPAMVFRTIGGILDLYFFLGPSLDEVYDQYSQAIGRAPMVPYWALGFQLCRWGYTDIDHMRGAVDRMRQYDIPHDIQYGDIDYMDRYRDFTVDDVAFAGLAEYVDQLYEEGTRYIIILDPGIPSNQEVGEEYYEPLVTGNELGVWIMEPDGSQPFEGEVWPGRTYYPDFSLPQTEVWWTEEIRKFKADQLNFAAIWIDMNEPSNFIHGREGDVCPNTPLNFPPYKPNAVADLLFNKTICMEVPDGIDIQYNSHSLYGHYMAKTTLDSSISVFGEERSIVFSRSTFPGSGRYGQHWLGDNWSLWSNLRWSIIGIIEFNMFGFPYTGSDICGFIFDTTEELCQRWQQLGAFYTFSRNHNADGNADQDPGLWPEVARITRETLLIRYTLLPYLYTLMYNAHTTGSGVLRGLFYDFTNDPNTYDISDQFTWGGGFLISPVLDEQTFEVNAYFPDARWYSYYDGAEVPARGEYYLLDAPFDFIPLHVRGGFVLPTQQPANSTMFSRELPMGLIVALDDNGAAEGELYYDSGVQIDLTQSLKTSYSVASNTLTGTVVQNLYSPGLNIDDIRLFGEGPISAVFVNGNQVDTWSQSETGEITMTDLGIPVDSNFEVSWQ